MRYLSLFSGIEAATQAWESLGWECVAVSEIEPFPCAVLEHHYPNVPNLGDVTKITEQQIKDLGQIDLIVFGSPCQNLSVAGNRKGLAGEQSSLFYAAMEIIKHAKRHCGARFALWENVPGAFSSNKGADFTEVVKHMAGLNDLDTPTNGWGKEGAAVGANGLLEWSVLDAQWFGLAQRRKRVFAIVDFGDWASRPPILLERESLRGNSAPSREAGQDFTANAIRSFNESGFAGYSGDCVAGTLRQVGGACGHGSECLVVKGYAKQRLGDYKDGEIASTCAARDYKDATDLVVCHGTQDPITNTETAYAMGCNNGQENVIAIAVSDVCGTLTRSHGDRGVCMDSFASGQCAIGRGYVRRLTPIECERLQGFPDDFTKIPYRGKSVDDCPNGVRYKALGNSMAVNVMAWIGKRIQQTQGIKSFGSAA